MPFPEISDEDNTFLDKWYNDFEKIKKPLEQLKAAEQFIDNYPTLVPAWGFEGEFLIDLKGDCIKKGLEAEIFRFLLSFRKRFPEVYQRDFGYFDTDLIYYYIIHNRNSEVSSLLENFELYPDVFPDELFAMVNVLAVKGESALLFPFLKKIHKRFIESNKVIGGYDILTPMLLHIEGKYLEANQTDEKYIQMCNEIKDILEVEVDEKFLIKDFWKAEHAIFYAEARNFTCNLKNKKEKNKAYTDFLKQFQRFLYETVTKKWVAAVLINIELSNYIDYTFDKKLVSPEKYFVLDKETMDSYIAQRLKDYFWINSLKMNALLTGVWYFVEFLVKTGNASEKSIDIVHKSCLELQAMEQKINAGNMESVVFKTLPIW
jgi:hypothetical protein